MSRRAWIPVTALLLTTVLFAGCGSSHSSSPTSSSSESSANTIIIKNFSFSPSSLTVAPGATVTVKNEDTATHTVTAVSPHTNAFNTNDVSPGMTATFVAPKTAGSYPYICNIHQFMHGTLVVS